MYIPLRNLCTFQTIFCKFRRGSIWLLVETKCEDTLFDIPGEPNPFISFHSIYLLRMILCCIESCQLRSALGMLRTKLRKNLQRDIKKKNNLYRFVVQYYF